MQGNHFYSQQLLSNNYNYRRLYEQHAKLEAEINRSESTPGMGLEEIRKLKRRKLFVLDQMNLIERERHWH